MFVEKALANLLADRDIRRSQHAELKSECEKLLAQLKERKSASPQPDATAASNGDADAPSSVLPEVHSRPALDAGALFRPFELACQSKSARMVTAALDSIQKLVAYGHIKTLPADQNTGKAGAGAVSPPSLASPAKSSSGEGAANAPSKSPRSFDDRVVETVVNCFAGPQTDEGVQLQVIKALLTMVTAPGIRVHENSLLQAVRTCYNIYLASRNLVNQTTAKATLNQMLSYVFQAMETAALEAGCAGGDAAPNGLPVNGAGDVSVSENEENAAAPPMVNGNGPSPGDDAGQSEEVVAPVLDELVASLPCFAPDVEQFNVLRKDCFLVFRSLCKLSMKPLPDGPPDPRSHELRSKILSMELIKGLLQNGGAVFRTDELFVSAIKSYLCVALSQNGVSNISEVFELSLAIFIELLTKYRLNLKSQIEIFFKEICLNILEAAGSSLEQKWMVLQGLYTVCCEAQIVIDIYVNYDCDLTAANIFERLVDDLSKVAQGRQGLEVESGGAAAAQHLHRMRVKGLECLVSVLKCMVEWSKDVYVNPHQQAAAAAAVAEEEANNNLDSLKSSASMSSMSLSAGEEDPSKFEKVKQHKHVIESGLRLFAQKPHKGLKYFADRGILKGESDADVAAFLHAEGERLDKRALGDLLGDQVFKDVMYAYVDQMQFAGVDFVSSLRQFLEGFQLPGEAQKIDRLMEKFASRYYECNPKENVFASADAAYVLAYSIIMLTTDLHSSQVKKKMTREEFIRNNRGINESEDLPEDYLSAIYDEIASSEIKMKSSTTTLLTKGYLPAAADAKTRSKMWFQDSETISRAAGALMESAARQDGRTGGEKVFTSATRVQHVRPMFKLIWSPLLATFSVGLQDCDDESVTAKCVEGMRCAIRVANIFGFSLERNAFIQALARFTLLTADNAGAAVAEMKAKNVEVIKALVSVAHTDGNYLETSWLDVMRCISQLELAQMIGSGAVNAQGNATKQASDSLSAKKSDSVQDLSAARTSLSEASSQGVIVAVDRIFTGSRNLSGDAIVHFFTALCQVSSEEMSHPSNPRMFSLVKLVEISYYNMDRIRLEWSRIWQVLGTHFNVVGCHDSQDISFFAVDSLKQLSMKFLEKGELQNFHFQKDFLRPFEFIMKNNKSGQIRDMVVRCLTQMVQSQSGNIKSGWKNVFSIFSLAAADSEETIVVLSFQTTVKIVHQLLDETAGVRMLDSFQDCVKCLSEYACNQLQLDIAMEAIQLIRRCAKYISEHMDRFSDGGGADDHHHPPPSEGSTVSELVAQQQQQSDSGVWIRGWFPVLFELSCIINRSNLDIRTRSLTILFDVVKQYGATFESGAWRDLFSVLFRIFDLKVDHRQGNHPASSSASSRRAGLDREWMDTTCNHALYAMTDVFNEFFPKLAPILLQDMLSQYKWCLRQENDQLSRSAVACIENLIVTNRPLLSPSIEVAMVEFLADIVRATATDGRKSATAIQVHLEILNSVRRVACDPNFISESASSGGSAQHDSEDGGNRASPFANECFPKLMELVENLLHSFKLAKGSISQAFDTLPLLIKQETQSYRCALDLLLALYHDKENTVHQALVEQRILALLSEGLVYFLQTGLKSQRDAWCQLLAKVFEEVLNFPDSRFRVTVPVLYTNVCDVLAASTTTRELRAALCSFLKRVGAVYGITCI